MRVNRGKMYWGVVAGLLIVGISWQSHALQLRHKKKMEEKASYITITKKDRCPVCGMFVSPYPKWITQIQFKDGTHYSFDGMKCLCKFYFDPHRYDPSKRRKDIKTILVRDYYTLKFIKYDDAYYVIGSDILGPMGHELIPFATEREATTFLKDHHGSRILRFNQITPQLLHKLDRGKTE